MKFEIRRTSGEVPVFKGVYVDHGGCYGSTFIDVFSLEKLISLMEDSGEDIILTTAHTNDKYIYPVIEIEDANRY